MTTYGPRSGPHIGTDRNRSARATYESHIGPTLTPMVDVVMVILIFFMASTVVLGPEWFIPARVPKQDALAPQTQNTPPPRAIIKLTRSNDVTIITINDQPTTLESLAQTLASIIPSDRQADAIILVQPESNVPYEDVVQTHATCTQAGYRKVGLGG